MNNVSVARFVRAGLVCCVGLAIPRAGVAQTHDGETDRTAIAAASRAFSAAYVRNDTVALGLIYSDSALLLPPNREVRGRAAITRYFAWAPNWQQIDHTLESAALTITGDIAVDVGTWTSTGRRGDSEASTSSEVYLVVWVRESDGVWRMLYDMWHRPAR